MESRERKTRYVMVKEYFFAPPFFDMTTVTVLPLMPIVRIIGPVTDITIRSRLLFVEVAGMTRATARTDVLAS